MTDDSNKRLEEIALFRYNIINELLQLPPRSGAMQRLLQEKAAQAYAIPGSSRVHVAAETMRAWIKAYRKRGFAGLKPKPRRDAGLSHALPRTVADMLCQIKEDRPAISVNLLIKHVRDNELVDTTLPLPPTTVHRVLSRAGLMRKKSTPSNDHRRFEFEHAGDMWMSDVMHGPSVCVGNNKRRKTYMITVIDDATRVITHAAFALSENTAAFLPVLKQAILKRGNCKRLYVDNGSAFRSHHLQLVCAKLGVTLIHARAYHPEGKGKIERYHRTVRMQMLAHLSPHDTSSLEALNRRLRIYIESECHNAPHRGLQGMTPLEAWAKRSAPAPAVESRIEAIDDMFLFEQKRKVTRARTVSLDGVAFEVDATLVGHTVLLRYDPDRAGTVIHVYHDGKRFADARPVDVRANCQVHRERSTPLEGAPQAPLQMSKLRSDSCQEAQ